MAWSIAEVARMSRVTSRTLRHYDDIGLLRPAYVGSNGYRYYAREQLLRLQEILLMRELGLGLDVIGQVLDGQQHRVAALDPGRLCRRQGGRGRAGRAARRHHAQRCGTGIGVGTRRDRRALPEHLPVLDAGPGELHRAGGMYVDNPDYRAHYDAVNPALAPWLRAAIAAYAEQRLG